MVLYRTTIVLYSGSIYLLLRYRDDEVHEDVEIIIPKRKDEIEAEERLKAKKEFAKKLAEMYSTMKNDSSRY